MVGHTRPKTVTHPSTNRAQRSLTRFMRRTRRMQAMLYVDTRQWRCVAVVQAGRVCVCEMTLTSMSVINRLNQELPLLLLPVTLSVILQSPSLASWAHRPQRDQFLQPSATTSLHCMRDHGYGTSALGATKCRTRKCRT